MAGTGFEPGTPTPPQTLHVGGPAATADLPKRVVERLATLRERVDDLHRILPLTEERVAASTAKVEAELRLKRLLDHPHQGGFGLADLDTRVVQQKRLLAELTNASQRLTDRYQRSHQSWNSAAQVLRSVEDWLKGGRPGGTRLEDYSGPVPKLNGKETLADAIERYRARAKELRADLERIERAPLPASDVKAKLRRQIDALARKPSLSLIRRHDRDEIQWPMTSQRSAVFNSQTPSFAGAEVTDVLGVFCWLHRDALVKRLEAEIDRESDDAHALSHEARERQAAELTAALIDVERMESACVWAALAQGLPIEHRHDCSPMAVLGCRLITLPT